MRACVGLFAVVWCFAAAGAVAYLHGFERSSGGWQRRPELIRVYAREVIFRAGPCAVLAAAAGLAAVSGIRPGSTAALAVLGSALAAFGTHRTIREYLATPPGRFMPATVWDGVALVSWLVGIAAVLAVAAGIVRRLRRGPAEPSAAADPARRFGSGSS